MRMRVFHFNGRIARGTTDCGRSSSTALQTRRSGATPSLSYLFPSCVTAPHWAVRSSSGRRTHFKRGQLVNL
ncbi:hypothetical protein NDU88_002946 [Pleurodeles waltl]|uniref:Uncharacterized protein n=1 Tax=Pleurodeles waltl TaxID=8319 RepID=A0AAV7Q862_PLEWA|nr:hypothetical protein NDU88_002946 [Pleurodeles waltl]